ncbi:MAG: hypothetical protein XXXJIFNMEKO3_02659 [Candidatus Erwinia impunctatus]|nr:hypothetical protein XXXJIFNMEKO_02659 [Culicoides impunctatus]
MSKSYDYIMCQWLCHSTCSLYALVDGLQYERYFGQELQAARDISYPLFDPYPDSKIAFAGPWLIKLNKSECYREKFKELDIKYPALSWLLSSSPPDALLNNFKDFLTLELPDGKSALFRFYDPRVLSNLTDWIDEQDFSRLIQGVSEWVFTLNNEFVDLRSKIDNFKLIYKV